MLASIETVLVTPDGDAMGHKVLQEWLQDRQVTARIAEEDLGHGDSEVPRVSYKTVVLLFRAEEGTKVKRTAAWSTLSLLCKSGGPPLPGLSPLTEGTVQGEGDCSGITRG